MFSAAAGRLLASSAVLAGLGAAAYLVADYLHEAMLHQERTRHAEALDHCPAEFVCPITRDLMSCPVVTCDGHTYERDAIVAWLRTNNRSPRTGESLPHKTLIPNYSLRAQIGDYRARHNLPPLPAWEPSSVETVRSPPHEPPVAAAAAAEMHAQMARGLAVVLRGLPQLSSQVEFALGLQPGRTRSDAAVALSLAQQVPRNPAASAVVQTCLATCLEASLLLVNAVAPVVFAGPPLVQCVLVGDVVAAERLVTARIGDPAVIIPEARTLLHLAALRGHERMVRFLLAQGVYVDAVDQWRATALHLAAFGQHGAVMRLLLDKGANPFARAHGGTLAIHLAAFVGFEEGVALLLDRGGDVSCTKENGHTLLHLAAHGGHVALTEMLLQRARMARAAGAGDDVLTLLDNSGASLLHSAAMGGSVIVARLLVASGIEVTTRNQPCGELALHTAAWLGDTAMVRLLVREAGSDLNAARADGCTVLHYASIRGDEPLARLALELGCDASRTRNDGFTALHSACWFRKTGVAQLLVAAGTSPLEARTANMSTALHFACWHGLHETAEQLLAAGASIEARTQDGDTLLHQAVFGGHVACVELLLRQHAHTLVPGVTPHSGSVSVLAETLVDARKRDGSTALHLAALKGLAPVVRLLLGAGANSALHNRGGVRPADLARQYNHADVLDLLPAAQAHDA